LERDGNIRGQIRALRYRKDARTRRLAAQALESKPDPRAPKPLLSALRDPDSDVRFYAALALGEIGDPRALKSLIAALDDESDLVCRAAAGALESIRDPEAVEVLHSYEWNLKLKNLVQYALSRIAANSDNEET